MDSITLSSKAKIKHLVVDSGGFIKNATLQDIGQIIYTLPEVVEEVKDKATKQRLAFLPYKLNYRLPPPDVIKTVTDFSKLTGDYPSLSAVDLKVIALTYLLEKENVGTSHLNDRPKPVQIIPQGVPQDRTLLPGHFQPPGDGKETEHQLTTEEPTGDKAHSIVDDGKKAAEDLDDVERESAQPADEGFSDDDESWVTPSNIGEVKKTMEALTIDDVATPVACLTTDFAIQNVLIQMGLKIVSVDGMRVKEARTFILRCHACFATTKIMTKQFCPTCGNKTLKRVAVSVDADGNTTMFINFRKPINIRGMQYSLPRPKGGKHANNPILCEDQRIPQNRLSKMALRKVDALDPDYVTLTSPFKVNDVYSRSAHLDLRLGRFGSRDPNIYRRNTGNHKRKKS